MSHYIPIYLVILLLMVILKMPNIFGQKIQTIIRGGLGFQNKFVPQIACQRSLNCDYRV
jgi:hypothetical protein